MADDSIEDWTEEDDLSEEKAEKEKAQILESVEKSDLHWVLSDPRGRRFLWRLLSERGVFEQSWVAGSFDVTAFNEGQRSLAIKLYCEICAVDEELYLKMMREAKKFESKMRRQKNAGRRTNK